MRDSQKIAMTSEVPANLLNQWKHGSITTVAELIEALRRYPPSATVWTAKVNLILPDMTAATLNCRDLPEAIYDEGERASLAALAKFLESRR